MNEPQYTVTVCITVYNQLIYIEKAIESVLHQTRPADEILIIDDLSTDGSRELLLQYQKKYDSIKLIFNTQNLGITRNRNIALQEATCEYLTFLDGDDYFFLNKLADEMKIIQEKACDFVYSNFINVDEKDNFINQWAKEKEKAPEGKIFFETLCLRFPFRLVYRSELVNLKKWRQIGGFDEQLLLFEDFEMRIRLGYFLCAAYNPQVSHAYRRHSKGLSTIFVQRSIEQFKLVYQQNKTLIQTLNYIQQFRVKGFYRNYVASFYLNEALSVLKTKKSKHYIWSSLRYCGLSILYFPLSKKLINYVLYFIGIKK